ncbi:MAG: glutamine--fructose-6-phosphate transaminase (isomerizing) [Pseudomonadota bacterium]
MCGIVGAVAERDVIQILIEGLKRLEYRGYDSAGLAVINADNKLQRCRVKGKVKQLSDEFALSPFNGHTGIAHTRWATHGVPEIRNAHPHVCNEAVALVHNGIIENQEELRAQLLAKGLEFNSDTDSEVIVNAIYLATQSSPDLLESVFTVIEKLEGSYALGIMSNLAPDRLIAVRKGSPLVIGVGIGEYFIASDVFALLPVTQQFIFLEEGDVADIQRNNLTIYDANQNIVERSINTSRLNPDVADKAGFRHYMLKEIFSQPAAIADTLAERIDQNSIASDIFGKGSDEILASIDAIKIVACGTSYHAGLIAAHWLEDIAGIQCNVEIASEFRYRNSVKPVNTLFICISQSGETADTLAALGLAKQLGYLSTLAICNVAESSMTRESDLVFLTKAGPEVGVASTKAFTTQLVGLYLLVVAVCKLKKITKVSEKKLIDLLNNLPGRVNQLLQHEDEIKSMATDFADKQHALFLGRGSMLPVAMEGALKLKEISYIHAESYAAGELKHGPLALVDKDMPVIAVAPNDHLLEKLKSNLQEVKARGGRLYVFADTKSKFNDTEGVYTISMDANYDYTAPILYTIPLQLLAYYVAVIKGADIDQPRNLAKSVTVE